MAIVATSGAGTKGICTYSFAFILILLRMQITFWWILKELLILSDSLVVHSLGVCFSEKSRSDWRSDGPSGTFSHLRTGPLELSSKCPLDYPCLDTNHSLSSGVLLDPMTWFLIWYASNIGCNKKKNVWESKEEWGMPNDDDIVMQTHFSNKISVKRGENLKPFFKLFLMRTKWCTNMWTAQLRYEKICSGVWMQFSNYSYPGNRGALGYSVQ